MLGSFASCLISTLTCGGTSREHRCRVSISSLASASTLLKSASDAWRSRSIATASWKSPTRYVGSGFPMPIRNSGRRRSTCGASRAARISMTTSRSSSRHRNVPGQVLFFVGVTVAPSAGFEPAHTAPEADALSPELRGRGLQNTWQKTWEPGRVSSTILAWKCPIVRTVRSRGVGMGVWQAGPALKRSASRWRAARRRVGACAVAGGGAERDR